MNALSMIPAKMVSGSTQLPSAEPQPHAPIAPAWHTAVVLLALLGFSIIGAVNRDLSSFGGANGRIFSYFLVMVFEWVIVAFIWYGIRRRGMRMANLVAGSWARPSQFFRDFGIAMAFIVVCGAGLLNALGYLLKATPNAAIMNLLPRSPLEIAIYLMLSMTAGFCEEVIFRGYLQRQFSALTRASVGGIVLQGVAFGLGHGYQGWKFMLLITIYGTAFGLLARWRCSLRPGMMAHFVQDGVSGIIARFLH
jgi:hypothetical protein